MSNGPLLTTIQNFMKFSKNRLKLDSVADPLDVGGAGGGVAGGMSRVNSTNNLLGYQDEKPMMTFGIADYPSLGFKEELAGMGGLAPSGSTCDTLYGCLSKFVSVLTSSSSGGREPSSTDSDTSEPNLEGMQVVWWGYI